jgi:hypothetical protein
MRTPEAKLKILESRKSNSLNKYPELLLECEVIDLTTQEIKHKGSILDLSIILYTETRAVQKHKQLINKLDSGIPEASIKEESLYTGEISDNTQTVISEDENGSNVDLSGSVTKEEAQETKPTEKPEPIGDTTNKGEVPSYPEEVPVTAPEVQAPADNSESSHPGQVYDPVFGWIDTGNTTYDVVDSDGDINKQIGTMGE